MNEVKLTANQEAILAILKENFVEEGAFACDVLEKVEGKTFNAVNATLASLAGKGLVTKTKAVKGDKMLTKYTLVQTVSE
jgi:Fe2+ or Zn2+ uptake regulation protein